MPVLKTEQDILAQWGGASRCAPVVSVCCITYNHEKFIESTLDGFLMQETDFPFEILIHDDASTDRTAEIIEGYRKRYPSLIRPILQKENQYSKRLPMNETFNFPRAQGKYIALCEGDDFWIDEGKLKRQFDLLEQDSSLILCAHAVKVLSEQTDGDRNFKYSDIMPGYFGIEEVLCGHPIPTPSIFCRNVMAEFREIFDRPIISGDKALLIFLLAKGAGFYEDVTSAVYRDHGGGVTKSYSSPKKYVSNLENLVHCAKKIVPREKLKIAEKELALAYLVGAKKALVEFKFSEFVGYLLKSILQSPFAIFEAFKRKYS